MVVLYNKKIIDIVNQDYTSAAVLYYFGIDFCQDADLTLEEVCRVKNITLESVMDRLQKPAHASLSIDTVLKETPLHLLIAYLKHQHHVFIKQRLTYVEKLISNLIEQGVTASLERDLKFVFPLFKEDFIKHVFHEEDTLFNYIQVLAEAESSPVQLGKAYLLMQRYSIQNFSDEHHTQEHEMKGVQTITSNYALQDTYSLQLKVIVSELSTFDMELAVHAQIENDILFPKALALEKRIQKRIHHIAVLN